MLPPAASEAAATAEAEQQHGDEPEQAAAVCSPAATSAAAAAPPEEAPVQPVEGSRRTSLPALSEQDAAARRGRNARLSMPAGRMAPAAEYGSRGSRLSLPGSMRFAAVSGEEAFAARPKLAMSPAASSGSMGRVAAPAQLDDEEEVQQQVQQADQQQQEPQQAQHGEAAADALLSEQPAAPVVSRSRLAAEDEEVPVELMQPQVAPSPAATALPDAAGEAAQQADAPLTAEHVVAEDEQEQQAVEMELPQAAEVAAPTQPADQQEQQAQRQADNEAELAAAVFAAKPKLAMSPAVSGGAAPARASFGSAAEADAAAAFATKPKLAMSPAVSSGSYGHIPAEPSPAAAAAAPLPSPAFQTVEPPGQAGAADSEHEQQAWQAPAQLQQHDSPTMSDNPLALAGATSGGDTPAAAGTRRRLSHSPALRCECWDPTVARMGSGFCSCAEHLQGQLMSLPACRLAHTCLSQWPVGRRGQQQPHVCWHAQPPHTPLCQSQGLHQPPLHWWVPGEQLGSRCAVNSRSRGMTAACC